jgi:hypothetical protein
MASHAPMAPLVRGVTAPDGVPPRSTLRAKDDSGVWVTPVGRPLLLRIRRRFRQKVSVTRGLRVDRCSSGSAIRSTPLGRKSPRHHRRVRRTRSGAASRYSSRRAPVCIWARFRNRAPRAPERDRAVNSVVPGNPRVREFEARFAVTMPERPWFGEVTEIPISKQRSRPERPALRKALRTNGKTRNAGRSFLSAVSGNSWGVGSSRRASKLPDRYRPRTPRARSLIGERASPVF